MVTRWHDDEKVGDEKVGDGLHWRQDELVMGMAFDEMTSRRDRNETRWQCDDVIRWSYIHPGAAINTCSYYTTSSGL